ncbi:hypothetical protein Y032_0660g1269 [Ancylostoma ceylanicum]|uniref:Uncharacterized protein n=1 Tax=Ancylostoma ceylanicum TaxID=53326 RepID=A0A016WIB0_9BILA|nr:hypothetical protein Y032_0660g1269 [Ancylostoma ceylanicum]
MASEAAILQALLGADFIKCNLEPRLHDANSVPLQSFYPRSLSIPAGTNPIAGEALLALLYNDNIDRSAY